jgi:hypothetical protein
MQFCMLPGISCPLLRTRTFGILPKPGRSCVYQLHKIHSSPHGSDLTNCKSCFDPFWNKVKFGYCSATALTSGRECEVKARLGGRRGSRSAGTEHERPEVRPIQEGPPRHENAGTYSAGVLVSWPGKVVPKPV